MRQRFFAGVLIPLAYLAGCSRSHGESAPPDAAPPAKTAVASPPAPLTMAPAAVTSAPIDLGTIPPEGESSESDLWPEGIIASSDAVFLAFSSTLDHGDRDLFQFAALARYSSKGPPRTLTNVESGPDIARLGRRLFFADKDGIGWVDVAGGSPTKVSSTTGTLVGSSATEVFVVRDTLAGISAAGTERTIAPLPKDVGPGVVTKTHFYGPARRDVVRIALSDGKTDLVADAPAGFYYRDLAASADEVVATLWQETPGGNERVLYSVVHEKEIVRAPDLMALAVGRTYLYFVKGQYHVEIVRVPLTGGLAEVLLETNEPPRIGTAGGGQLVWATDAHVRAISIPDSP